MAATTVFLPGNMCDLRLWEGGDELLLKTLPTPQHHANLSVDATIEGMAERALRAVDGPLLLVGFSMGAIVALAMAGQAPERITGLILVGLNAGADLPERAAHRPQQQAQVRAGGLERVLVEELKPNYLGAAHQGDRPLLDLLRDMGMALGPEVFVRQSEALRTRPDYRPVLRSLQAPLLLLCGAEDRLCPPEWHRRWQAEAPDAELVVIEGAGHMVPLEAPAAIASAVTRWLGSAA